MRGGCAGAGMRGRVCGSVGVGVGEGVRVRVFFFNVFETFFFNFIQKFKKYVSQTFRGAQLKVLSFLFSF